MAKMSNKELHEMFSVGQIAGQDDALTDAVLDVLDRLMALPVEVRVNLVAAVEAFALIEEAEQRKHSAD